MGLVAGDTRLIDVHNKAVQMLAKSINKEVTGSRIEKTGIPVITAHSFINKGFNEKDNKNTLLIIDKSSMLGNRIYYNIKKKIVSLDARGIFSGDIKNRWQLQIVSTRIKHEQWLKIGYDE